MTCNVMGPSALDYLQCRYGTSKILFRGPRRQLDKPYIAFLGGTETYGKFIADPFPALVETALEMPCVNFGYPNAGIDVFSNDSHINGAAINAEVTVIQILGAQNMTNRFYSVHPRRNDRFVGPTDLLKKTFHQFDFSEFHFNKHMLSALLATSPDLFATVRQELQSDWVARMKMLLRQMRGKTILFWFGWHLPCNGEHFGSTLGDDPLFITRAMMDQVAPFATEVVEVKPSAAALVAGTHGMFFTQMEALAACEMMSTTAHAEAAAQLSETIGRMI